MPLTLGMSRSISDQNRMVMRAKVVLVLSRAKEYGEFKMTRLAPLLANKRFVARHWVMLTWSTV